MKEQEHLTIHSIVGIFAVVLAAILISFMPMPGLAGGPSPLPNVPVPVGQGGTGATTASDALTNLGVPGVAGGNASFTNLEVSGTTLIQSQLTLNSNLLLDASGGAFYFLDRGGSGFGCQLRLRTSGVNKWFIGMQSDGTDDLHVYKDGSTEYFRLLYSSGAASFSGDVTIGGKANFASAVIVIAESAAAAPVPNTTFTIATYSSETTDTHSAWDGTTFTAPRTGWYHVNTNQYWAAGAGTIRAVFLFVNGAHAAPRRGMNKALTTGGNPFAVQYSSTLKLTAGEQLTVQLYQDSGGALNQGGANFGAVIEITEAIGP